MEEAVAVEGEEVAGGEEWEGGYVGQCVTVRGGGLFKLNAKVPVMGSEEGGRKQGREGGRKEAKEGGREGG